MQVTVRPFDAKDLHRFEPQDRQRCEFESHRGAPPATQVGQVWTALAGGVPICIAGIVMFWPGRAITWAYVSKHAGPHMRSLTNAAKRTYDASEFRRIEFYVDAGFAEGQRWARLLGFTLETPLPMRACLPSGADAYLFARVQHHPSAQPSTFEHQRATAAMH